MRFLLITLLLISCKTDDNRIISLNEIGWSFELPSDVFFKDSAFNPNGQINKSSWKTSSFMPDKPRVELFWIESDRNNYFNTIVYIDSSDNLNWVKKTIDDSRFYFSQLENLSNYKIIDTSLSIEKIDEASFQKEYLKVYNKIKSDTTYSYKFSRKYNNYGININIRFTDVKFGSKYLSICRKSKFKE